MKIVDVLLDLLFLLVLNISKQNGPAKSMKIHCKIHDANQTPKSRFLFLSRRILFADFVTGCFPNFMGISAQKNLSQNPPKFIQQNPDTCLGGGGPTSLSGVVESDLA